MIHRRASHPLPDFPCYIRRGALQILRQPPVIIIVMFHQAQYHTRNARLIADELGITVVPINPLSYEWREEMINVANALAK